MSETKSTTTGGQFPWFLVVIGGIAAANQMFGGAKASKSTPQPQNIKQQIWQQPAAGNQWMFDAPAVQAVPVRARQPLEPWKAPTPAAQAYVKPQSAEGWKKYQPAPNWYPGQPAPRTAQERGWEREQQERQKAVWNPMLGGTY